MKLQNTLDTMKETFESDLPPEIKAAMHKATDDLATSGIMEQVLQPGEQVPTFTLLDHQENEVSSEYLLKTGPVVVSFYRGSW